jgi:hypothetical protein
LKHQKNLPLDPIKNPAHKGIIKRFELYSFKFNIKDINEFIEGACKGLSTPLGNAIGNGNGNGNDLGKEKEEKENLLKKKEIVFKSEVFEFSEKYNEEMLNKFCNYWTEKNKSLTKMRFELEKIFEISKRIATWAARDNEYNKSKQNNDSVFAKFGVKQNGKR